MKASASISAALVARCLGEASLQDCSGVASSATLTVRASNLGGVHDIIAYFPGDDKDMTLYFPAGRSDRSTVQSRVTTKYAGE